MKHLEISSPVLKASEAFKLSAIQPRVGLNDFVTGYFQDRSSANSNANANIGRAKVVSKGNSASDMAEAKSKK